MAQELFKRSLLDFLESVVSAAEQVDCANLDRVRAVRNDIVVGNSDYCSADKWATFLQTRENAPVARIARMDPEFMHDIDAHDLLKLAPFRLEDLLLKVAASIVDQQCAGMRELYLSMWRNIATMSLFSVKYRLSEEIIMDEDTASALAQQAQTYVRIVNALRDAKQPLLENKAHDKPAGMGGMFANLDIESLLGSMVDPETMNKLRGLAQTMVGGGGTDTGNSQTEAQSDPGAVLADIMTGLVTKFTEDPSKMMTTLEGVTSTIAQNEPRMQCFVDALKSATGSSGLQQDSGKPEESREESQEESQEEGREESGEEGREESQEEEYEPATALDLSKLASVAQELVGELLGSAEAGPAKEIGDLLQGVLGPMISSPTNGDGITENPLAGIDLSQLFGSSLAGGGSGGKDNSMGDCMAGLMDKIKLGTALYTGKGDPAEVTRSIMQMIGGDENGPSIAEQKEAKQKQLRAEVDQLDFDKMQNSLMYLSCPDEDYEFPSDTELFEEAP